MMSTKISSTWLITGTSNGFGLALAHHVLTNGHNLVSLSRHPDPHSSLITLASSTPSKPTLHHIQHDLSNPSETTLKSTLSTFLTTHPTIQVDYIVNNAAITVLAPLETIPTSTISHVMTVNFWSPLWIIQALLPHMRSASTTTTTTGQSPKAIINISSTQGLTCDPSEVAYESSKHALEGMSGVLAAEILPFGIRTLVVNLGSFRTGFATSGERAGLQETGDGGEEGKGQGEQDVYADPHPAGKRIEMVRRYVKIPNAARGDPGKGAEVVFDAVMRTEGSEVEKVLETQRVKIREEGGRSKLERLVLGSDAQPKIEKQVEYLKLQVDGCRAVSALANADDVE